MDRTSASPDRVVTADGAVRCLSIHDFVRVNLPFDAVVGAFAHFVTPDLIGRLVIEAWIDESSEIVNAIAGTVEPSGRHQVEVTLGGGRGRRDAVILPIAWTATGGRWIPPLEADLEIVEFGSNRTHLHVLGLSQMRPETLQFSDRASLEHRLAIAVVRHFLFSLAQLITQSSGWTLTTHR